MNLARLVLTTNALRIVLGQGNCPADANGCLESGVLLQPRSLVQKQSGAATLNKCPCKSCFLKWGEKKKACKAKRKTCKKLEKNKKKCSSGKWKKYGEAFNKVAKKIGESDIGKIAVKTLKNGAVKKFAKQIDKVDSLFANVSDIFAKFGDKKNEIKNEVDEVAESATLLKGDLGDVLETLGLNVTVLDSIEQVVTLFGNFDKKCEEVEEKFQGYKGRLEKFKDTSLLQIDAKLNPIVDAAKKFLKDKVNDVLLKKIKEIDDKLNKANDKIVDLISSLENQAGSDPNDDATQGLNEVKQILEKTSMLILDAQKKIGSAEQLLQSLLDRI